MASMATIREPMVVMAMIVQLIFALLGFLPFSLALSRKAATAPSSIPMEEVRAAKKYQQIEDGAEDWTGSTHRIEYGLQGDKKHAWPGLRLHTCGKGGRNRGQSRQKCHRSIHDRYQDRVFLQILLFIQIRTVGDHAAGCQGQREEKLTAGKPQNGDPAGTFEYVKIRLENKLQPFGCAFQGAAADNGNDQKHRKSRHGNGTEFFDTAGDTLHDDKHGQNDKNSGKDDRRCTAGYKAGEIRFAVCTVGAPACTEDIAYIGHDVLDDVPPQHAVKGQQKEWRQNGDPAV